MKIAVSMRRDDTNRSVPTTSSDTMNIGFFLVRYRATTNTMRVKAKMYEARAIADKESFFSATHNASTSALRQVEHM